MNGNISEEGIRLDLEWMHRAGIGGFQLFDAARTTPQIVPKRIVYMTPAWRDALRHSTQLAERYGMEESIAASPGWSETGGPWVKPADGMKKYVWSETVIDGGRTFTGKLQQPPITTGSFQDRPKAPPLLTTQTPEEPPMFYADSAVVAFRDNRGNTPEPAAVIDSSDRTLLPALLADGKLSTSVKLAMPIVGEKAWIRYSYTSPTTIRSVTLATTDPLPLVEWLYNLPSPRIDLEASDDGSTWREVQALPSHGLPQVTVAIPATTARFFRVSFLNQAPGPVSGFAAMFDPKVYGYPAPVARTSYEINELVLHQEPLIDHFEAKAGFLASSPSSDSVSETMNADRVIRRGEVVDLTSNMAADGTLTWTPPAGRWVVLRFGYSLIGMTNNPAEPEATGLEVDKLDGQAVRRYLTAYLDSYQETLGAEIGRRGVTYMVNDSWEAGPENWTPRMLEDFRQRRGYDPAPWLPVLTGRIVDSPAASERFLWDFRKTIGDLIVSQHYGVLQDVLHSRGMGQYVESHESGRSFNADGMEVKKFSQVPMGAMWARDESSTTPPYNYDADDRETASVAHIYGQNLAAAESFTANEAPYSWSPATMKRTADLEFLNGINRIVVHTSVHQPLVDAKPGITLGPFGQWFNRNETWAEQARPWTDYLARSSYMLQQGHFVADVLSFYGENTNVTEVYGARTPDIPRGYAYDFVNADAIVHSLKVDKNGRITTPGGGSYRLLDLGRFSKRLSLPALQAIRNLVVDGASVVGIRPEESPSLADDPKVFASLSSEVFGEGKGTRHLGKGVVYVGDNVLSALDAMGVRPDFDPGKEPASTDLGFVHRQLTNGDIYFVSNQGLTVSSFEASFRERGRIPELWHADTGTVEAVSYRTQNGRTYVPMQLNPSDSVFVIFRRPALKATQFVPRTAEQELAKVEGAWELEFPSGWGAPPRATLPELNSWTENSDPGVRYFSGTAIYSKVLDVPADWLEPHQRVLIHLGDVKNLASVSLNGHDLGEVWHAPYALDITSALRVGANRLRISVTNSWVNRLIGDEQPGAAKRYTFTTYRPYTQASPILPSGLLGPVTITSLRSD
ncbi:Glycosyl hydrolases family 2, sugar binding domain [Granulicella rosea]|uniref:Glycosyl hydrolases family 2, sugar binding domain n=2 Tax=Granulicella rosea TaxID=474952 RepID=A0A239J245_9BACT|nr:Glycosyl hydrolases family 2, sugar binding domain [Granulicella rosea]